MARNQKLLEVITSIERMDRLHRGVIHFVQMLVFALSGLGAFLLRFDLSIPASHVGYLKYGLVCWIVVKTIVFRLFLLDRGWWRYIPIHDVARIAGGNLVGSAASAIVILIVAPRGFPRSLYFIDFLICLVAITGIRIWGRWLADSATARKQTGPCISVLIYGAGMAGVTLLREIRSNNKLNFTVIGFVDDNAEKKGISIQGVKVLGAGPALRELVSKYKIEEVLSASICQRF